MGGGAVWRGVAKLLPPAGKVVATAAASTSCGFCRVNSSSQPSGKATSASLRSCSCPPEASLKSSGGVSLWDENEWEFAEGEDAIDHLVFGKLPSRTEVEEATSELQDALRLGLVVPSFSGANAGQGELSEKESLMALKDIKEEEGSSNRQISKRTAEDWMEPPPLSASKGALAVGGSNVVEAFQQLQHNPEVKSMVVSLATDPAVWGAVLANEKIQAYKRQIQGDKGFFAETRPVKVTEVPDETVVVTEKSENIFSVLQKQMSQFMESVWNTLNGFFKFVDKAVFAEEAGDAIDRTIKSCTMLAFVVLCVVIVKRGVPRVA